MDRDRHLLDWVHGGNYHGLWGAVVMTIYAGVALGAGFPVPLRGHPLIVVVLAAALGFVVGKAVGTAVLGTSGRAAQSVYMPSAKGSYVTQHSHIDALEARYPALGGTIRDYATGSRRPFLRFFACEQDYSLQSPDTALPAAVASGASTQMAT